MVLWMVANRTYIADKAIFLAGGGPCPINGLFADVKRAWK